MDWQQWVSFTIVAAAAVLLLRRRFRRGRFDLHADTSCGCPSASSPGPQGSIVFRARKGQRREVVVKMK